MQSTAQPAWREAMPARSAVPSGSMLGCSPAKMCGREASPGGSQMHEGTQLPWLGSSEGPEAVGSSHPDFGLVVCSPSILAGELLSGDRARKSLSSNSRRPRSVQRWPAPTDTRCARASRRAARSARHASARPRTSPNASCRGTENATIEGTPTIRQSARRRSARVASSCRRG